MTTCDNCGLSCSNPVVSTLGTACSYACSMALVGKHPKFFARCLHCGKPVGKNPIPHGQRGWTCSPSCDFTLLCAETFYGHEPRGVRRVACRVVSTTTSPDSAAPPLALPPARSGDVREFPGIRPIGDG